MRRLFLIWVIIAAVTAFLIFKNPPSTWLPPSVYLDNENISDNDNRFNPFANIDVPLDNETYVSSFTDLNTPLTKPATYSTTKELPKPSIKQPPPAHNKNEFVLNESFESEKDSYWTGEYTTLNGRHILSFHSIDNKYFGVGASYQPPTPIAYLNTNMELSFSYFTGNNSSIYLSFYNDTKNDNFHYEWRNLVPHSWETVSIPIRWFTDNENLGKPLDNGDKITRLNFYAGTPAKKPIVYIDNVSLRIVSKEESSSAANEEKNLFIENFETTERDWHGIRTADLPGKRNGKSIKAIPIENKWFGVTATYESPTSIFSIDKNPYISFEYFIEEQQNIYVSVYNKSKGDNYHYWIKNPTSGSWQSFKKNFLFFSDNSFKGIPISPGDVLTSVRIFAGKPGQMVNLWIDDIKLEATDTQLAPSFELQKRAMAPYTRIDRRIIENLRNIYTPDNRKKSIMNLGDSISNSMAFVWPMRFSQQGMLANEGYYYFEKEMSAQPSQKSFWGKALIDKLLKNVHPETITILFGTNDILLGGTPGAYMANMEYIIDRCLETGSIPILLTIPPTTRSSLDNVRKYNNQLEQLAFEKQIPVIDVFQLFIDHKDWKSLLFDGVHPNFIEDGKTGGYDLINSAVFEMYKMLEMEVMQRPKQQHSFIPPHGMDSSYPEESQVLFSYNFERGSQGWGGLHTKITSNISSTGCLQLQGTQELAALSNIDFNIKPTTCIAVSVYAENCHRFRVQLYNRTNKDNFWAARENIPQKQWTRYYFDLNTEFQDNSNTNKYMYFEDQISNLQIYGDVVDTSSKLYIDDVVVYNVTPESCIATLKKDFNALESRYDTVSSDVPESCPLLNKLNEHHQSFIDTKDLTPDELQKLLDTYKSTLDKTSLYTQMKSQFPIKQPAIAVGVDSAMRRISPYHPSYKFRGDIVDSVSIYSAQNEYEHIQLYLIPLLMDLENVTIKISDAQQQNGSATISSENFSWFVQGFVSTKRSWPIPIRKLGTKPDPLLPGTSFTLTDPQPLLVRIYIPHKTPAGTYSATITISADDSEPVSLPLTLNVWDFAIPTTGTLYTPTTLDLSIIEKYYGTKIDQTIRRKWYSFCLEHRIDPTNLYHFGMSPVKEDLDFCLQRGLRTIILGGNHYSKDISNKQFVQSAYTFLKSANLLDKAMIYIGDEPYDDQTALANIRRKSQWVKDNCPGLKTFAGAYPTESLYGYIDVWDPQLDDFKLKSTQERQEHGEEVMWYVAAGPPFPYPNVQIDNDLIEARILFWMTYAYDVQGFEYYYINLWGNNIYGRGDKKWPDVPWNTYSFYSSRNNYNGDGNLIYPGKNMEPYGSLRLIAIQDGIEDYEMFTMLKNFVDQAKTQPPSPHIDKIISEAEEILDFPDSILTDFVHYTRDPQELEDYRIKAGKILEKLSQSLKP